MEATFSKSRIQRAFKMRGLSIRVDAMEALRNVLQRERDPSETLHVLLDEIKRRRTTGSSSSMVITKSMLAKVVSDLSRNEEDVMSEAVQLLDAFLTPRLEYEATRGRWMLRDMESEQDELGLYGEATDKVDMFIQRYTLVHQRIMRQDLFRSKLIVGSSAPGGQKKGTRNDQEASSTCTITPVESLLGRPGIRTLLGMIVQVEEGRYYLEDLTAQVPMDLTNCKVLSDGYLTENSMVLVEGELNSDGILQVHNMGHPPQETRNSTNFSKNAIGLEHTDLFRAIASKAEYEGLREQEIEHGEQCGMFVVLSDVHLDDETVLEKLEKMFEAFNEYDPPPVFVLMGNFTSKPLSLSTGGGGIGGGARSGSRSTAGTHTGNNSTSGGIVEQMTALYSDLADLISKYPPLAEKGRFVFVPGPHDPPNFAGNVLPQGPIPGIFTAPLRAKVKHAIFASNPCRIRFFTKELLFFRQGMTNVLRRNCILPPRQSGMDDAKGEDDMDVVDDGNDTSTKSKKKSDRVQHVVKTMLDQGHLCPLPLLSQPIYWKYDHALRLYPLPDALICADDAGIDPYCRTYLDCVCVHPGSFFTDYSFAVFYPVKMGGKGEDPALTAVELSQVD